MPAQTPADVVAAADAHGHDAEPLASPDRPSPAGRRVLIAITAVVAAAVFVAAVGTLLTRAGGDTLAEYGRGDLSVDVDNAAFRATFPRQPARRVQSQVAGDRTLEVISFVSGVDDGQVLAGYTDYPPEALVGVDRGAILDDAPARLTAQLEGGKVTRTRDLTMFDVPAVEIEASGRAQGRPAAMIARMFLRENRIFFLIVVGEKADRAAADRFFRSFRLAR